MNPTAPSLNYSHADSITEICDIIHIANSKWWEDLETGKPLDRNVGEMLALVHSEVSEALEGYRKSLQDNHLPHRSMLEVELADAVIRIFDMAAGLNLDIGAALVEKHNYNLSRADHKVEARRAKGGKKF